MSNTLGSLAHAVIAVFASFGRDAQTLGELIERTGAQSRICSSAEELCAAFSEDIAAILVTEESLAGAADSIHKCLDAQPVWSDVPLIVLSGSHGRRGSPARWNYFRRFGNVTILDRPLSGETVMIALEAACRARALQYVVRDQMQMLEAQNLHLEHKVLERTQALQIETDERKRIESALNEARRLEAIGRLASGVAHDFNNLLQVVSSACNLLPYARHDAARTATLIDTILRASERGSKLTKQMLAFGRRQLLSTDALDVGQHVMGMKELLQRSLSERATLELRLQADLWHINADVTQLEVALLNLTINAKDVLPSGGVVTLAARNIRLPTPRISEVADLRGDFVWLSVSDNGPGMAPDVVAQAFEPFFTTKRIGEGSGLGLSQVYGFAKQSGGGAWIRTGTRGTTVSVLLPRGSAASSVEQESRHHSVGGPDQLQDMRVLFVEDDEAVGEVTVSLLNALGCDVHWARNADEALRADLYDYDVVVSDVQMSGSMDGIALAREIRRQRPDMPIVVASGYAVASERLHTLHVRFIDKPYSMNTLRKALMDSIG